LLCMNKKFKCCWWHFHSWRRLNKHSKVFMRIWNNENTHSSNNERQERKKERIQNSPPFKAKRNYFSFDGPYLVKFSLFYAKNLEICVESWISSFSAWSNSQHKFQASPPKSVGM
jgi:hypothetical protein